MAGSKIFKRGYKAKLKRDLGYAVDIGESFYYFKGRYLTRCELEELIKTLRESDPDNLEDMENWYLENLPEAIEALKEEETRLQAEARKEEQVDAEEK